MSAREWFTLENTPGLKAADLAVLNRAVRNRWPVGSAPARRDLMELRAVYRDGMSANDLLDAVDKLRT